MHGTRHVFAHGGTLSRTICVRCRELDPQLVIPFGLVVRPEAQAEPILRCSHPYHFLHGLNVDGETAEPLGGPRCRNRQRRCVRMMHLNAFGLCPHCAVPTRQTHPTPVSYTHLTLPTTPYV